MGKIMKRVAIIFRFFVIFSLVIANTACAKQTEPEVMAEASYARLCTIYTELNSQLLSADESTDRLVTRLRIEVPELDYVIKHIFNAARKDVYAMYKASAEEAINKPWDCPAIKDYYQRKWKK